MLRAEHPLYSGLVGNFICRAALEKLNLYDPVLRPAPARLEMGRIEDVSIFYHPDTNEYEVSDPHIGVRFPARYVPVFGPDIADEEYAAEIALAISGSAKKAPSPYSITDRFPFIKLGLSLPPENRLRKIPQNPKRNRLH